MYTRVKIKSPMYKEPFLVMVRPADLEALTGILQVALEGEPEGYYDVLVQGEEQNNV